MKKQCRTVHQLSITLLCLLLLISTSCATIKNFDNVDRFVYKSDYPKAIQQLETEKNDLYPKTDAVLYNLDSGLLNHYAGNSKTSNDNLAQAEKLIYENFAKSIMQNIGAFIVNDHVLDYSGEEYEDIYCNIFMALNYIRLGKIEDAFVEIRRFDTKLKENALKYQAAIAAAQINAGQEAGAKTFEAPSFYNSALARYLSMLLYFSAGKPDSAAVDYRQIQLAFKTQKSLYPFAMPVSISEEFTARTQNPESARLNVLAFTGLAPIKQEDAMRVMIGDVYYKLALPIMTQRPSAVASIEVFVDGIPKATLQPLESMERIAIDTFKQNQGLIYFRTVTRSIAKAATGGALDTASRKEDDKDISLLLSILSFTSKLITETSETADLRTSRYFPATAHTTGISLAPGVYSIAIVYKNSSGKVIAAEEFPNTKVQIDTLNLVESICLK